MTDSLDSDAPVPDAVLQPRRRRSVTSLLVWIVPLVALVASATFAWVGVQGHGPTIVVHADHGHGLGPGDAVRYRGIDVGVVLDVHLGSVRGAGVEGVELEIQMRKEAAELARAGTRFWIVRPQVTLDSVEGLETIIGARYVSLSPGPEGAERRSAFSALSEPPLAEELSGDRGVEIVLEAPTRFGLQAGAALTYRGVRIGTVVSVGLASDATAVEVRAIVRSAYSQLVRERSVFWETGGIELGLSLTGGLKVDLDSARSALVGGVAMATPLDAGPVVSTGWRFRLHDGAEEDWLEWAPALPLGSDLLPPGTTLPELLRGSLTWSSGRILRSQAARPGWMHVTRAGLRGPADLLAVPESARESSSQLQVAGRSFDLEGLVTSGLIEVAEGGAIATVAGTAFGDAWDVLVEGAIDGPASASGTPPRPLTSPEDLVVLRETGRDPIGVDAARLSFEGDRVRIDERIAFSDDWHGAAVLARSDGALVGLLLLGEAGAAVVALP